MSYACQRLLDNEDKFILQAADVVHEGTTDLSTICFIAQPREDDDGSDAHLPTAHQHDAEKPCVAKPVL